ncbi:MAG TPA: maleylpyruvate isomerase N-terminal domain-containing protein [Acidimicrobiales bacterium]|nr:maleylpyruvate isomerase N-terminal domain-containing protein [Acidimicrobiales bacterium]
MVGDSGGTKLEKVAAELDRPSALEGWSRLMVLAHLRYVASAMRRMTEGALAGRSEPMYPGGRANLRPHTIVAAAGESAVALVASLHAETAALERLWHTLSLDDWRRRIDEPDHGPIPLSQLLVLRLTETEVHGTDLGFAAVDTWDERFVEVVLPLRLAWLDRSRHRPDADLSVAGSWLLSDGRANWLVVADGADVHAYIAGADTGSDCRLTASRRDLLALLLGRPPDGSIERSGNLPLADAFKRAFPGP